MNEMTFDLYTCWFVLTTSKLSLKIKVIDESSRSYDENVAKVVAATSSGGFLVY